MVVGPLRWLAAMTVVYTFLRHLLKISQLGGAIVRRTLASVLVAIVVCAAVPASAQGAAGAGKLELTIVPGGWLSFTQGEERPEPGFGQYLAGGTFTVNWSMVGIEAELFAAPGRPQNLDFGTRSVNQGSPMVVLDSVNLVVPLAGNSRTAVPYVTGGLGEVTIMRTSDNVLQPDTETLTAGSFGGGVKWYTEGRWGFRGDYRFTAVRSKFDAPGSFFGREFRKSHRIYGALVVKLISR